MRRAAAWILVSAVALTGCENMGLEYAGTGDDAEFAAPPELVVAANQGVQAWGSQELIVDGRLWVPSDFSRALSEDELRTVGSTNGHTVYARSWDRPPYDALFTRLPEDGASAASALGRLEGTEWLSYLPVIGGGPRAGAGAGHDTGDAAGGH